MQTDDVEVAESSEVWSLSVCLKTINSPWEAMFLSQTAADTASWSETEKKKAVSQTVLVESHRPSFLPSTLLNASPTSAILL